MPPETTPSPTPDPPSTPSNPPLPPAYSPQTSFPSPPFLCWPVSRQEFYRSICLALVPALAWGFIVFGIRPLAMLLFTVGASSFTYLILKLLLRRRRALPLLYTHCLLSALVLVALAHPTWPIWIPTAIGLVMPLVLVIIGGPGRERIHVAVAAALAVQYIFLPLLAAHTYTGKSDAILARDRLFAGDIRDQSGDFTAMHAWPTSLELAGDDAVVYAPPAETAAHTLDEISFVLPAPGSGRPERDPDVLSSVEERNIREILDRAFTARLPAMDSFAWGVAPNRVGAASLGALVLAGLFLSYRYILRPRSVLFFLLFFIAATAAFTFTPGAVQRAGVLLIWDVLRRFPGEIITLFNFLLLNSDAPFAAVIILALPGTEPLTARGRRIFLAAAAMGAAALHRLDPATPAATLALCALMPLAPLFDRVFTQRSWLNARRRAPTQPPRTRRTR